MPADMTLLTMVQSASDMISLPRPVTVVGNSDNAIRILLACAQMEGRQLARRWTWQRLARKATFTAVAQEVQTGAIPADYDGRFLAGTFWNTTLHRVVPGPLNPQEWQQRVSSVGQGPYPAFRIQGNALLMAPPPTAGETHTFEYITRNFCVSDGGVEQSTWAADTDVGLLDEELMLLGLIWRFKQSRGMDYAEDMRTYEMEVTQAISRDGSRRTVNLAGDCDHDKPMYPMGVSITVGGGDFYLGEGTL